MPFVPRRLIAALVFGSAGLIGQDIDTSSFGRGSGFSLQDRTETEAERRAFEALEHSSGSAERQQKAEAFLSSFPSSWLLASVYQIAAAASFEAKDYGRTLIYGRRSLQIMPENAPLLLTLATIEKARGARQQARADARDALLWL